MEPAEKETVVMTYHAKQAEPGVCCAALGTVLLLMSLGHLRQVVPELGCAVPVQADEGRQAQSARPC